MTRSLTIARVGEVDVRLHPTFALVFLWVLIDWRRLGVGPGPAAVVFALLLILLIFACVLVHEFGHVFMARQYGVRVHDVSLSAVGGVARMDQLPLRPQAEVAIAFAGPLANLALTAALLPLLLVVGVASGFSSIEDYALTVFRPSLAGLFATLLYANILIILSNLIPAFPMDGGRILRAALSTFLDRQTATRAAALIGEALALALLIFSIFVFQSLVLALLAIFIMVVAFAEDRAVRLESALRRMQVGQFTLWDMGGIAPDLPLTHALRGGPRDIVVTQDGKVVGMLWRNQLLAELAIAVPGRTVRDIMEQEAPTVDAAVSVYDVQQTMSDQQRWAVAVTEGGVYRGIFTGDRFLHIYRQLTPDPLRRVRDFWHRGPLERLRT